MRGQIQHRSPQTTAELHRAYGDALPDVDTDRGATLRGELVRSSDCAVPDRTGSTDNLTSGRPFDAAAAECARLHCRGRARSSRLAARAVRCGRTTRADLACDVRPRT